MKRKVRRWLKRNAWMLIYLIAMLLEILLAWRDVREIERAESVRWKVIVGG